jgi:O-antigen/teichoic acid export membrane protein
MTGTSIAQAIPIAISPILTRIYTPEDFGVFALYISVTSILSVFATGGYEYAIMLPVHEKDAKQIIVLSLIITSIISLFIFCIIGIFNNNIVRLLGNDEISGWIYLIPASVLLSGIYRSLNYWSTRKTEYKNVASSKIAQSVGSSSINLLLGWLGSGSAGLLLGSIGGQVGSVFVLAKKSIKEISIIPDWPKIFVLARQYIDFMRYSILSSLLNSLSFNLLSIIISKIFSSSILGFYSLVYRIMTLPGALLGSAIRDVYFQESTKFKNAHRDNKAIFISTLKKLSLISGMIYIPMYFYIEELVIFVFGQKWRISGEIAKILIPLMAVRFVSSSLSSTLITYEKQKAGLFINFLLMFNVILVSYLTNIFDLSYTKFFYFYMITNTALYCIFLFYYYNLAKGEVK